MAEYTYLDIFATKGIEYIVVMIYFVLLVLFTKSLNSKSKKSGKTARKD